MPNCTRHWIPDLNSLISEQGGAAHGEGLESPAGRESAAGSEEGGGFRTRGNELGEPAWKLGCGSLWGLFTLACSQWCCHSRLFRLFSYFGI